MRRLLIGDSIRMFYQKEVIARLGEEYSERDEYLSEDMIHPNESGVKTLAAMVADAIKGVGRHQNEKIAGNLNTAITKEEKTIQ